MLQRIAFLIFYAIMDSRHPGPHHPARPRCFVKGRLSAAILLAFACVAIWAARSHPLSSAARAENPQSVDLATVKSTPIYLADFELHVVPPRQPSSGTRTAPTQEKIAADKAKFIVEHLGAALQQHLKQAGYSSVQRIPPHQRPSSGVRLRGVFAEPDERNHIRRVVLGSASKATQLFLYVCTDNLAKPEQAFYQIVSPETPGAAYDPRMGVLITLTSYAPLAKFEFSRDPSEEDLRKAAREITAQLTGLLIRNALAIHY